jgi:hypothetical protein
MKRLILHPFAFGLYPTVALLAANIDQVDPRDGLRSALLCLVVSALFLLLYRLILHSWEKAGILASLTVLPLLSYGHVYEVVKNAQLLGIRLGRHRLLFSLWGLALVAVAWALLRSKRSVSAITQVLNVVALAAILIPGIEIGIREIRLQTTRTATTAPMAATAQAPGSTEVQSPHGGTQPDVYYVILDTYTRQDVLQAELGYDNSAFVDQLTQMGFFVADCGRANYLGTEYSLSSSLNMQLLDTLAPDLIAHSSDVYDLNVYMLHNQVADRFRKLGYRIVGFESGYSPTEWTDADAYVSTGNSLRERLLGGMNPFEILLLRSSVGLFVFGVERQNLPYWLQLSFYDQPYILHRDRILFELSELQGMGKASGPKFVFVHILAPHDPFVIGPNGDFVVRDYPFSLNFDLENAEWPKYVQGYTGQVTYLNKRILAAVAQIIADSKTPPIIILQGDHGIPRMPDVSERTAILNAYLFPGEGARGLYKTITPVNTFRLLFDEYFGDGYPLLPDKSFVRPSPAEPFRFVETPETSPGCLAQ